MSDGSSRFTRNFRGDAVTASYADVVLDVLERERDHDLLIFQVDLFSARGEVPATVLEAAEREKDIRFSSRTRMNTDMNKKIHDAKKAVRELIAKLPESFKDDPLVATLNEAAKENTVTVVHLIYRSKMHETSSKDYDFSRLGMTEHWAAGERDVYASMTHQYVFDYHEGDIYWCTADVGWVTGHSYIVYGPLANGATTLMFEGVPTYPTSTRFWDVVDKHQVNIFYTAPTAIRALMRDEIGRASCRERVSSPV